MSKAQLSPEQRPTKVFSLSKQVQDFISMGFLLTGLLAFNPWLILLLLVSIIPSFLGESYFNSKTYALTRSQTPERRELDYVRYLGASDATAKEIKIFGLSDFIIDRFRVLSDKFYKENSKLAVRRSAPYKTHWSGSFKRATKYRRGGYSALCGADQRKIRSAGSPTVFLRPD